MFSALLIGTTNWRTIPRKEILGTLLQSVHLEDLDVGLDYHFVFEDVALKNEL